MDLRTVLNAAAICLVGIAPAQAGLLTHVDFSQLGATFSYTVFNDEPTTSQNFVSLWHLNVNAPFTVTSTPAAWDYFTDNATYVDWFNTDSTLPYPNDVAPGTSLSGFVIESTVATSELQFYSVNSWDHLNDSGGPNFQDLVAAPSVMTSVPEPGSAILCATALVVVAGHLLRRWSGSSQIRSH